MLCIIGNNKTIEYQQSHSKYMRDEEDTPYTMWWKVDVRTARHVVYDVSETRKTSCKLWFYDDKSPLVKIYGWEVVGGPDTDLC